MANKLLFLQKAAVSIAVFLIFFAQCLWASEDSDQTTILTADSILNLAQFAGTLEDPRGDLNLENIVENSVEFIPNPEAVLNFGLSQSVFWVRFIIHNPKDFEQSRYLLLNSKGETFVDVFIEDSRGVRNILHHNESQTFDQREVAYRHLVKPVDFEPGVSILYIRYQSKWASTWMPVQLLTREDFHRYSNASTGSIFFFTGAIFILVLFNLIQYFAFKQKLLLNYCYFQFFSLLMIFQLEGHGFQYLWPQFPALNDFTSSFSVVAYFISGVLFLRSFLNTKLNAPRVHRVTTAYIYISLLLWGLSFISYEWLTIMLYWFFVTNSLTIVLGFYCVYKRIAYAMYFLLATGLLIGSLAFYQLSLQNLISPPWIDDSLTLLKVAHLLEGIIFSYAIAQIIKQLREKNKIIKNELIDILKARSKDTDEIIRLEKEKTKALSNITEKTLQLASASHDLRQPIYSIKAILMGLERNNQEVAGKAFIHETLDYMEAIIAEISKAAEVEHQALSHQVSLNDIFEQVYQQNKHQAVIKDISLCFVKTSLQINETEKVALTRILDNLVKNAIRYTSTGKVLFGARRSGEGFNLEILDQGAGIETRKLQEIMKPFRQSGLLKQEKQGSGLGLFIVKNLCDELGYQLRIESFPRQGSRIIVSPFDH